MTLSIGNRVSHLLSLLGAVMALAIPATAQAAYVFTTIDVAGANNTAIWDINNSGTMVGYSTAGPSDLASAFVRSADGTLTPLAGPAGAVSSVAMGISDGGRIVGSFSSTLVDGGSGVLVPGPSLGFIYAAGSYTSFQIAGAVDTYLRAISSDGHYLSGYYTTGVGSAIGFVYHMTTGIVSVTARPDSQFNIAQGVNNAGIVVGSDVLGGPPITRPGFLYDTTTATRTDVQIGGASRTALRAIDEAGTLAGWFVDGGAATHGFIGSLSDHELIDIAGAAVTYVEGSNDARWVVGEWIDANGMMHGYVGMAVPEAGSLALALMALLGAGAATPRRAAGARGEP